MASVTVPVIAPEACWLQAGETVQAERDDVREGKEQREIGDAANLVHRSLLAEIRRIEAVMPPTHPKYPMSEEELYSSLFVLSREK